MLNRIDRLFADCKERKRAALVLYLTAGFPDAETTRALLPVLADSGADLIELGVPFSDPIADGPVIQRASTEALAAGMTFDGALALLAEFRRTHETPVVLFGALNPFQAKGLAASAEASAVAGADGILAADLPVEEADEFRRALWTRGLHLISLVAPTTTPERAKSIAEASSGFLYCISLRGVTGVRTQVATDMRTYVAQLREATSLPLALGFGIAKPEHVRSSVDAGADAVVVGSALIQKIEELNAAGADVKAGVAEFVRGLAAELRR